MTMGSSTEILFIENSFFYLYLIKSEVAFHIDNFLFLIKFQLELISLVKIQTFDLFY